MEWAPGCDPCLRATGSLTLPPAAQSPPCTTEWSTDRVVNLPPAAQSPPCTTEWSTERTSQREVQRSQGRPSESALPVDPAASAPTLAQGGCPDSDGPGPTG